MQIIVRNNPGAGACMEKGDTYALNINSTHVLRIEDRGCDCIELVCTTREKLAQLDFAKKERYHWETQVKTLEANL